MPLPVSPEVFFEALAESPSGERTSRSLLRATSHTSGPWQEGLQHAGPPGAALVREVSRLGGLPPAALPARLCFDILGPVPVADLALRARVVRPGSRIVLTEAELAAADRPDRPLMTLRAWLLRQAPEGSGIPAHLDTTVPEHRGTTVPRPPGWLPGYLDAISWSWVEGSFERPGPATIWALPLVDLVAGEPTTPIQRLVALSDSASGISAVADPETLLFVNTDLTIHLDRTPQSESLWLRAESFISPAGIGRTTGVLGDEHGALGQTGQTLFVAPRGATG